MTTIHEFQQILWVTTPLGDGVVLALLDYGMQENSVFLVMLEDGKFKFVTTNQCTACENHTLGIHPPKP